MAIVGVKKKTEYNKPEGNYRELKGLNQSMLGVFDENPMQFYQEFILGNKRKKKSNYSFDIGDLADFYLLDCHGSDEEFNQRLDEKFALLQGNKSSAQCFELADIIIELSERDTSEDGIITSSFTDRFQEAFQIIQEKGKYKGKTWEKGLEDFEKNAKEYFETSLSNIGKTVVDLRQIDKAKKIIDQLRTDEFLSDFINQESDGDIEVLKKVGIEFDLDWKCKSEIDFLHINHKNKTIYRRDLKTAFDNESFEYSYIKYYYYLQNSFYYLAVKAFAEQNNLEGYSVSPMDFLVLDTSINSRRPLLYTTTEEHVLKGLYGFEFKENHYKGVYQLIDEISWANDNSIWNISKENYNSKGIVQLKDFS